MKPRSGFYFCIGNGMGVLAGIAMYDLSAGVAFAVITGFTLALIQYRFDIK